MEQASLDRCLIAMRQRQMVFQGYEWVCPECHHRNWVDMAELRSVLTCTICRHEVDAPITFRSAEHTSELQSLMRISYAVFCLKKKKIMRHIINITHNI